MNVISKHHFSAPYNRRNPFSLRKLTFCPEKVTTYLKKITAFNWEVKWTRQYSTSGTYMVSKHANILLHKYYSLYIIGNYYKNLWKLLDSLMSSWFMIWYKTCKTLTEVLHPCSVAHTTSQKWKVFLKVFLKVFWTVKCSSSESLTYVFVHE